MRYLLKLGAPLGGGRWIFFFYFCLTFFLKTNMLYLLKLGARLGGGSDVLARDADGEDASDL